MLAIKLVCTPRAHQIHGSKHQFESFDRISNSVKTLLLSELVVEYFLVWVGVFGVDCSLFGSSWLQFGGWLLCNQPQDAALFRVALFIPSGHCWQRQWSKCIVCIPFVDVGNAQRQFPE